MSPINRRLVVKSEDHELNLDRDFYTGVPRHADNSWYLCTVGICEVLGVVADEDITTIEEKVNDFFPDGSNWEVKIGMLQSDVMGCDHKQFLRVDDVSADARIVQNDGRVEWFALYVNFADDLRRAFPKNEGWVGLTRVKED